MASAFVRISNAYASYNTPGALTLVLDSTLTGTDVPGGGITAQSTIDIPGNISNAAFRTQVSASVSAEAQRYGATVVGADMVLPAFQKG